MYQELVREPCKSVPSCNESVHVLAKEGMWVGLSAADRESLEDTPPLTAIQLIRVSCLSNPDYKMKRLKVALANPQCHLFQIKI